MFLTGKRSFLPSLIFAEKAEIVKYCTINEPLELVTVSLVTNVRLGFVCYTNVRIVKRFVVEAARMISGLYFLTILRVKNHLAEKHFAYQRQSDTFSLHLAIQSTNNFKNGSWPIVCRPNVFWSEVKEPESTHKLLKSLKKLFPLLLESNILTRCKLPFTPATGNKSDLKTFLAIKFVISGIRSYKISLGNFKLI